MRLAPEQFSPIQPDTAQDAPESTEADSGLRLANQFEQAHPSIEQQPQTWRMPGEHELHDCTWMAFGASKHTWKPGSIAAVQSQIAAIARTIAEHEPVKMLVRPEERELAQSTCGPRVTLWDAALDDIWIRDSGPVFVLDNQRRLGAVAFNFNGWGGKQQHADDATIAASVAARARAEPIRSVLTLEGGGIEVDGEGTAILCESCIVNRNRNPERNRDECEAILKQTLGLEKIIWLPGIAGRDITDGHVDGYARFAGPGTVVVSIEADRNHFDYALTRRHLRLLSAARDARERPLEVVVIENPRRTRKRFAGKAFCSSYVNFYIVNGGVLVPEFGDPLGDQRAADTLQRLFPQRRVSLLNIDAVASGGGGIHCVTQQQPLP
ncbi:MAG: agmatine deiminase family protein [Janthinobacterium lividum]